MTYKKEFNIIKFVTHEFNPFVNFMKEAQRIRNGRAIIEVRSDGGKLLYVKTKEGYEMKCPRTKKICVVGYDQMLFDCLKCLSGISDDNLLFEKTEKIRKILETPIKI